MPPDPLVPTRRGGPTWIVAVDLFRNAGRSREWMILALLVLTVVAAGLALVSQTVVPWAIYPAL